MKRPAPVVRSAAWMAFGIGIALLAIAAFLNDRSPHAWQDWAVAATIVAGISGAIVMFKPDSMGRSLMWLLSLSIVTLLLIYDVLDALLDPFMQADWPIGVVAIVLVVAIGVLLDILISDDE
jgi:peptidoglycan/LPS O-acetylase OafA/YrhL